MLLPARNPVQKIRNRFVAYTRALAPMSAAYHDVRRYALAASHQGRQSFLARARRLGRFRNDWFSLNIIDLESVFSTLELRRDLAILEIGSFEGMSACYFLDRFKDNIARLVCVDSWEGSMEHTNAEIDGASANFDANVAAFGGAGKVQKIALPSQEGLSLMQKDGALFDLVYIDGSHTAADVEADGDAAWPLLKVGGIVVFDDYLWEAYSDASLTPLAGVHRFFEKHRESVETIRIGYQISFRRIR
jgi:predicted O-methyltransferase YrrM